MPITISEPHCSDRSTLTRYKQQPGYLIMALTQIWSMISATLDTAYRL